ncbi:MAG TPA: protein kinase, partial [Microthrixaceae bacterium]|nr:protein kinase [Microthrixaceae bacterium]
MSPRLSEETGRLLGDRYQLMTPIGVGTSSRVYLAMDNQLRRRVAVKLLHESLSEDAAFLKRFRAEARAAGALSHQNIVSVFDWGEDTTDGVVIPYLVTEYLGGGSLQGILANRVPLTPSQTLIIGIEAARALEHAHKRGLVHRDVKPANLLFDEAGGLRLADFGLARALAEASWTEPIGSVVGTARYISPEQALGRRVNGHSDVYSLALVLVECLTGQVPFASDTREGTLAMRTHSDLMLDSSLGSMRAVLERAGRLDPEERQDAAGFVLALMAIAGDFPPPERLPLVPTLGDGEGTSEMHIAHEVAILGVDGSSGSGSTSGTQTKPQFDADHGAADRGPIVLPHPDPVVVATAAPPASDAQPKFAEAVGSDTESQMLAASRPRSLGPVEPLISATGDMSTPAKPRRTRPRFVGRALIVIALLALIGGGLSAWWFLIRVPVHDVPALVGKTVSQATTSAEALGFKVDSSTQDRKDGTKPGQILAQEPASGSELAEGEQLKLTVSLGPTLTTMPAVVNITRDQAVAALTAAGLTLGTETQAHDEGVPAGSVISSAPAPGQEPLTAQNQIP